MSLNLTGLLLIFIRKL